MSDLVFRIRCALVVGLMDLARRVAPAGYWHGLMWGIHDGMARREDRIIRAVMDGEV